MLKYHKNMTEVGAVFLALGASTAVSSATVDFGDLSDPSAYFPNQHNIPSSSGYDYGYVFNSGSGYGDVQNVELALGYATMNGGTSTGVTGIPSNYEVYITTYSGGTPALGTLIPLGTINTTPVGSTWSVGSEGSGLYGVGGVYSVNITDTSYALSPDVNYAIVFAQTNAYSPELLTAISTNPPPETGVGSTSGVSFNDAPETTAYVGGFEVDCAAPESALTGTFMGVGALSIAGGSLLRRKLAGSSKA